MVQIPVNPPAQGWSLTVAPHLWKRLSEHLFHDGGEHGAVLLADVADGPRGSRLLGRELILATDDVDYVPGTHGYRALTAQFVRDAIVRAHDRGQAYLAVHNHPGTTTVGFSRVDMASHERGYPALLQISGQLVGALVLTPHAAAGDLWLPGGGRAGLSELVVPGSHLARLRQRPASPDRTGVIMDRQARLYGDLGQQTLNQLRVAVVGLGGVGSIVVEYLARLGVGHLVLIDDDVVELTNLPRLLGARVDDVGKPKVELAARNASQANPDVVLELLPLRVEHPDAQRALTTCDWIFLAADSHAARHFVNLTVQRHLIPATQIGVKVEVDSRGNLGQIHTATRLFLPGEGCMWCNGLIDPTQLAIDLHPAQERQAAQYVPHVPAPAVIALNALATAEGVNHFMFAVTGLHETSDLTSIMHLPRIRDRVHLAHRQDPECTWCAANLEHSEPDSGLERVR